MSHDIFISYSARDQAVADALCAELEKADISCWIAPRDITPGVKYAEAIVDGISQCRVFLLILSSASNDSPQVEMEVDRAASKDLTILSFRIDNVALSKAMEYYLSSRHWLDASKPPIEKHLQMLVRTVNQLLGRQDEAQKPLSEKAARPKVRKAPPRADLEPAAPIPAQAAPLNPFTFGNSIDDPLRFHGRKQEIRQILNRLLSSAHESTSVVGERRIGKTSLLNYLSNPEVAASLGLTREKWCLVYVDFQGLTDITPQRFWQRILSKMSRSIYYPELVPVVKKISEQSNIDLFDLEDLFDAIHARGLTTILFMDEFEYVTQNPNFRGDFFGSLRALAIHHGLALVPATRRQLVDLCYSDELKGSPFFNIFANVILRPFLRMEVEELLDGYSRQGQIALTPAERDLIWNMAGGYPFFVQMAGYYLIEGKMQGLSDQSLSDFTLNNFTQQSSGHFAHLWSTCSDGEKSMLIAILALGLQKKSGWAVSSLENLARVRSRAALDLPALNKRGLLDENAKIYSIFSRTFGNWIQQEILALSGEEETDSNVDELLRKQSDILKPLKDTLPLFKKKYWPILIDIAKGFTAEADPATLLRLLK